MENKNPYRQIGKIFGWRIYISKGKLRWHGGRNKQRNRMKYNNLMKADFKCSWCGSKLDKFEIVSMHSYLDHFHPTSERYAFENCVLLCPKCNKEWSFQASQKQKVQQMKK